MKNFKIIFPIASIVLLMLSAAYASDMMFSAVETHRVNLATNSITLLSAVVPKTDLANCRVEWQVFGPKIWWAEGGVGTATLVLSRSMTAGEVKSVNVTGHNFDLSFIADPSAVASVTFTIYKP